MKNNFKNRRDIVPKWITYTLITMAFLYPIVLIMGEENLFDLILNQISNWAGPDANFIYLLILFVVLFSVNNSIIHCSTNIGIFYD